MASLSSQHHQLYNHLYFTIESIEITIVSNPVLLIPFLTRYLLKINVYLELKELQLIDSPAVMILCQFHKLMFDAKYAKTFLERDVNYPMN